MREPALQHSPALKYAPKATASSAASMSASGKMSCGFLPPSSMDTFFRVAAPAATAARPTLVEPVNEIMSTSGICRHRHPDFWPVASDDIASTLRQARFVEQASKMQRRGQGHLARLYDARATGGQRERQLLRDDQHGKFHGVMIETTPIGSLR